MLKLGKSQLNQISNLLKEQFTNKLLKALFIQFKEETVKVELTEIVLKEWISEADDYEIISEDCVSDYCRIKLLNLNHFNNNKHKTILDNILLNHELSQEKKIVFLEKYLYDDLPSTNHSN